MGNIIHVVCNADCVNCGHYLHFICGLSGKNRNRNISVIQHIKDPLVMNGLPSDKI